jgi:hypothetical protein
MVVFDVDNNPLANTAFALDGKIMKQMKMV